MVDDGNNDSPEAKSFNYDGLVEDALKNVVKKVLRLTSEEGLVGKSHFFISFNGTFSDVEVPSELKSEDNEEIKIIIQHQFWDLISDENHFEVTLSFNGKKKKISVPYNAITSFTDPSVGFGLQFKTESPENIKDKDHLEQIPIVSKKNIDLKNKKNTKSGKIISLDEFRHKK